MKRQNIGNILFVLLGISLVNFFLNLIGFARDAGGAIGGGIVLLAAGIPFIISFILAIISVLNFVRTNALRNKFRTSIVTITISFILALIMTIIVSFDDTSTGLKLMLPFMLTTLITFCVILVHKSDNISFVQPSDKNISNATTGNNAQPPAGKNNT